MQRRDDGCYIWNVRRSKSTPFGATRHQYALAPVPNDPLLDPIRAITELLQLYPQRRQEEGKPLLHIKGKAFETEKLVREWNKVATDINLDATLVPAANSSRLLMINLATQMGVPDTHICEATQWVSGQAMLSYYRESTALHRDGLAQVQRRATREQLDVFTRPLLSDRQASLGEFDCNIYTY